MPSPQQLVLIQKYALIPNNQQKNTTPTQKRQPFLIAFSLVAGTGLEPMTFGL
jgi:hypothetical protein